MEKEQKEWWLFGVMAVLVAVVVLLAWLDVPELAPATVTRSTTVTVATPTTTAAFTVSLNSATAEELMKLPGLGEKTAEKIIAYRNSHSGFASVEQLLEVEGIGEKKLAQWAPYLTL